MRRTPYTEIGIRRLPGFLFWTAIKHSNYDGSGSGTLKGGLCQLIISGILGVITRRQSRKSFAIFLAIKLR